MKKESKTNAMRILDTNKAEYSVHTYQCDNFLDGVQIAQMLNQPCSKTYKTLVTVSKSKQYYVFVIPVDAELDLKKAASSVGEKAVSMIHVKDINSVTGYIRGGCSPIGMKKQFKTVIDETAKEQDTIFFSGGKLGAQIEMNPIALSKIINCTFDKITY